MRGKGSERVEAEPVSEETRGTGWVEIVGRVGSAHPRELPDFLALFLSLPPLTLTFTSPVRTLQNIRNVSLSLLFKGPNRVC